MGDKFMEDKLFVHVTPKQFFTVSEAAEMLRVSRSAVYRLLYTGQLEYYRVGCRYIIEAIALSAYLNAHKGGN